MGNLMAGAAKRSILPSDELIRAIALEDPVLNYFDGAYEDIFVRVLVITDNIGSQKTAFVSADLNRYPDQEGLCRRMVDQFGIDPMGCIIGSIRNHQAPCGNTVKENPPHCRRIAKEALNAYTAFVHERTMEALAEAIRNLRSARLGSAVSYSNINTNIEWDTPAGCLKGVNYSGFSDKTMTVMKVVDQKEELIGVFVSYPVHSTMFSENTRVRNFTKIGGDVVGAICRFVEKAKGDGFPVVYMAADGGDQELMVYDEIVYTEVDAAGNMYPVKEILPLDACRMLLKVFASQQGVDILRTLDSITEYSQEYDFFGAETYREVSSRMAYDVRGLEPGVGEQVEQISLGRPLHLRLRLAVLNGIAFAGYNAEITSLTGTRLRESLPYNTVALIATCFGHEGTIPDEEHEALNSKVVRHSFCLSAKEAEEKILDGFRELSGKEKRR